MTDPLSSRPRPSPWQHCGRAPGSCHHPTPSGGAGRWSQTPEKTGGGGECLILLVRELGIRSLWQLSRTLVRFMHYTITLTFESIISLRNAFSSKGAVSRCPATRGVGMNCIVVYNRIKLYIVYNGMESGNKTTVLQNGDWE